MRTCGLPLRREFAMGLGVHPCHSWTRTVAGIGLGCASTGPLVAD